MSKPNKSDKPEILFELDKNIEGGMYSNMANVVHNKNEFLIDFAITLPGKKAAKVQSRIITSPAHAKQLFLALKNNIEKYEQTFGVLDIEHLPPMTGGAKTIH